MIPKNIYVFWHQDKLPLVVYKLFLNIKHKNQGFKVTKFCDRDVLKIKDKPEFFNSVLFNDKTRVSDWLRMYLLYHYGGIWIDITCFFISKSLNEVIDVNLPKVQGFHLFENVFENWLIASPPKNKLIKLWLDETEKCLARKFEYTMENINLYQNNHPLHTQLPHLAQHLAFLKIITENNLEDEYKSLGSSISENNPLNLLKINKWNTKDTISFLLSSKTLNPEISFIKLRGPERRYLLSRIQKKEYSPESFFIKALKLDNSTAVSKKKKKNKYKHDTKKKFGIFL